MNEAQFRVKWIGKPQTPHEGQVGVECVDSDKIIWDVDFAKAHEEFEPFTANLKPSDTPPLRYNCQGKVLVSLEQGTAGGFEAQSGASVLPLRDHRRNRLSGTVATADFC